jgi:hypothetical protein
MPTSPKTSCKSRGNVWVERSSRAKAHCRKSKKVSRTRGGRKKVSRGRTGSRPVKVQGAQTGRNQEIQIGYLNEERAALFSALLSSLRNRERNEERKEEDVPALIEDDGKEDDVKVEDVPEPRYFIDVPALNRLPLNAFRRQAPVVPQRYFINVPASQRLSRFHR